MSGLFRKLKKQREVGTSKAATPIRHQLPSQLTKELPKLNLKKSLFLSTSNYVKAKIEKNHSPVENHFIKLFENCIDRLLSAKELAVILGVPIKTLRDWILKRKIPFVKVEKLIRFHPITVAIWLTEKSFY